MKSRPIAVLLSLFLGFVGIQKFYLRQTWFGVMYVLLSFTFVPFIASLLEALVYACMSDKEFDERFNKGKTECPKLEKQEKEPIKIQIRFGNNEAPEIPQEKEAVTAPVDVESDANKTPAPVQESPAPVKFDANKIDKETSDRYISEIARKSSLQSYFMNYSDEDKDDFLFDAAKLVVENQNGSASFLQQKLSIGYNRAGKILDELESRGIVGAFNGSKPRDVLVSNESDLNFWLFGLEAFAKAHKEAIDSQSAVYKAERLKQEAERLKQEKEKEEQEEKERIKQQILEKRKKRELRKAAIEELTKDGVIEAPKHREPIPQEIKDIVWNRDGGRCVICGSRENLEFDHIIPFSKGGATTVRNLQLLCQECNRKKSNHIG